MLNVFATLLIICEVHAETYRVPVSINGVKVYEDISIDRQHNLMTVSVGGVDHIPSSCKYSQSINLHDFQKGALAVKKIDSGECVITKTNETLLETLESLENVTRYGMHHTFSETRHLVLHPITNEQVMKEGGIHIGQFCKGYKSFIGVDSSQGKRFLDINLGCLLCFSCRIETHHGHQEEKEQEQQ